MFIISFPSFLSLEFIERVCHATEILNKTLVEFYEFQEAFHFFYLGWGFLFFDYLDFIVFHLDFFSFNYYFQNRYLLDIKVTL